MLRLPVKDFSSDLLLFHEASTGKLEVEMVVIRNEISRDRAVERGRRREGGDKLSLEGKEVTDESGREKREGEKK